MKTNRSLTAVFLIVLGIGFSAQTLQAQTLKTCPVMPGHNTKEKFSAEYRGKKVYFCCRSCVKSFKKHPERYLKNFPENYFE